MTSRSVRLWSDEPSPVDLLAFGAVAETAVEAVLDDVLDPIALGISGPWGSGKSTVLRLIERELSTRNASQEDKRIVIVRSEPWRYDPSIGAKSTLISEVLTALDKELKRKGGMSEKTKGKLRKLAKRVNWVKALKLAAKSSITLQLPKIDDLTSLVSEGEADDPESRNLDEFKKDFADLLKDNDLAHVQRVVVLVDDLDRCLPDTVVETLETMRLFLSVPKISFVIAADEERVADAIRERYPKGTRSDTEGEEPARLYLHKIVQTTLKLPALSRFDTEAYLLLLLLQNRPGDALDDEQFAEILAGCTEIRASAGAIDSLEPPAGVDIATELQFAARLTPMLYEKLRGSPRRIKRFLNDLNVRASIARRRGIELDIPMVAKLMLLEQLLPDEFSHVLDWLARGELRERLAELEKRAGRVSADTLAQLDVDRAAVADLESETKPTKKPASPGDAKTKRETPEPDPFSEGFIRWAKMPPSLGELDLSPYLHLAASFVGTALVDAELPERLRDIAANLLSSSRVSQKSVSDQDLQALPTDDVNALVGHLGRMGRDRPADLLRAVGSILRVSTLSGTTAPAESALQMIPVKDIRAPAVLLFSKQDAIAFKAVLERWAEGSSDQAVKNAVANALTQKGDS